jgi:hypothetical protein
VPKFVQIGTAAPGGSTMSSVYLCGVKRSGNTFTYFWKGAVFRRSTGLPIDPDTGDPAEIPDAVVIGTDTSTLVSGTVDAPLRLFGGYDIDSFGSAQDSSWAAMWNAALSDSDILALMDAGYPACGTLPPAGCDDDLTDDDIISFRWDAGDSQLVNRVVCEFDYDAAADSYDKMLIFSHDSSIARYGPRPELRIRSKGLTTANDADDFLEDRAREIFTRFGDAPPAVLQVECFYRKGIAWEVGDIICVSSAFIPNLQISGRGISEEQFELVDVRPQFGDRGKLVATLLDVEAVSDQPPLPVSITEPGATFEPLTTLGLFGNTFGTWT